MHDVIEVVNGEPIYPYLCSRCGRCYLCCHKLIGYKFWVCADGFKKPIVFDPGVPVRGSVA